MMIIQKMKIIQKLLVWFLCLAILSQNAVESPVLCLESDGHMNIEIRCDTACKVPIQKNDSHQDTCDDCIDISFWNYIPDFEWIVQSTYSDVDVHKVIQESFYIDNISQISMNFQYTENSQNHFPTFLTNTILLI